MVHAFGYGPAEKQFFAAHCARHHFLQTGFVNRYFAGLKRGYFAGVRIDADNPVPHMGHASPGHQSHITCSNYADIKLFHCCHDIIFAFIL